MVLASESLRSPLAIRREPTAALFGVGAVHLSYMTAWLRTAVAAAVAPRARFFSVGSCCWPAEPHRPGNAPIGR